MNYNVAIIGLIEIFSALTIGIFILALTYKLLQWVGRRYYSIEEYNLAYSIFTGAIILSVGIMVEGIIDPLISAFRLMGNGESSLLFSLKYFGIGAIYIAIAYTAAVLIGLISTFLYSKITPIDEFEEIRNDNLGVAIIVSSIIITLTIFSKDGVKLLIEALVPYPELPPTGF
ncbi:DUF350 domain-containing protein [Marinoscillum sp.]|uniref:DUF350 domain-containing protein n=1 Tax=Marinoscillum sp. TaxID=2024838 RepID=UPI003BA8AFF2